MYDHSFLELEEIMGDEKWSFEVLESKFLTCKERRNGSMQKPTLTYSKYIIIIALMAG